MVESSLRAAGAEQVSDLAIRQPAVIYVLQRELWSRDGDAFAAGLELACRIVCDLSMIAGRPLPRLGHSAVAAALEAVRQGACERQTVRWIRDQIDELNVVLTRAEEDAVATVIAAIMWATARAQAPASASGQAAPPSAASRGGDERLGLLAVG
jgi:hypothetical protein